MTAPMILDDAMYDAAFLAEVAPSWRPRSPSATLS